MTLNRFLAAAAVLLAAAADVQAQSESLTSIFTNADHGAGRPRVVPRRSSIIFIACHGLAFGDLSCYGQTNFQTPNIDRLAAEGTRFTNYRVTSDDFTSALGALATGSEAGLTPGQSTVGARLADAGYRTWLVGEWTLGQPWTQGFGEFAGFLSEEDARNYYSDFIYRYAPAAISNPTNQTRQTWNGREEIHDNTGGQKLKFIPDVLMGSLNSFAHIGQPTFANHRRPFFILVDLPAPQTVTPGKDDYPVPTDAPYSGENWPQAARNRAALVTRLDNDVGRLMEQLSRLGMSNNVAIFLAGAVAPEKFADTNLNFLMVKGEVRGGQSPDRFRAPMIVRWPGHVPAGRVSDAPWRATDFTPTALDIAYAEPARNIGGISVLPLLQGEPDAKTPTVPDTIER